MSEYILNHKYNLCRKINSTNKMFENRNILLRLKTEVLKFVRNTSGYNFRNPTLLCFLCFNFLPGFEVPSKANLEQISEINES